MTVVLTPKAIVLNIVIPIARGSCLLWQRMSFVLILRGFQRAFCGECKCHMQLLPIPQFVNIMLPTPRWDFLVSVKLQSIFSVLHGDRPVSLYIA